MARKKKTTTTRVTRLEARTRAYGMFTQVAFLVFCLAVGFVILAAALPQKRKLAVLESQLKAEQAREASIIASKEDLASEFRAIRQDPAYLEIQARDRLDYFKEGERVLRIKREN
jgi:cell division protein FtsB